MRLPTSGQINISGILYQMLASLAHGVDVMATMLVTQGNTARVELAAEPFDGGDFSVDEPRRTVVQVKRRAAHRRWTFSDIVGDVLRDLLRAVRSGEDSAYLFLTDNDDGCEDFRRFLGWFRAIAAVKPGGEVAAETFRVGRGGRRVDGQRYLRKIREKLGLLADDDPRLVALLNGLEIVRRSESELMHDLDSLFSTMVERVEEVPGKRSQLIGQLLSLASSGASVQTSELLRTAELDARRLVHAGRLAVTLREELEASFPAFRYQPRRDVRQPLPPPTRSVTVLRGESGLGKTWRLCATAYAMAEAGRAVVLLRASADVHRLRERIATLVWNPMYSGELPLRSIAARLRPALADDRGIWLTVFLDDLNDPRLAAEVLEDHWAQLGIALVVSSQPATADWLRMSFAAPEMVEVPEFATPELITYLDNNGVDHSSVQDDVFSLLHRPVLATLYCRLPRGLVLSEETEYQLMQSFWAHAATERPAGIAHTFDLDQLQLLVGDMLDAPPVYPWPPAAFARTLDFDAVERLVRRGLVELDGDRRLSMTHDRLLNWTMARHIADTARDRGLVPQAVLAIMRRTQDMQTVAGVRIGARFGYVLMDLLWLLLEPGRWPPAQVAELLLLYMRDPEFDSYDQRFFRSVLPTLGARAVPLMREMARSGFAGDGETLWPAWLAEGLRRVADVAWEEVRATIVEMFANGDGDQPEIALRVMAKVGVPELLDRLHALNIDRAAALDEIDSDGRIDRFQAKERSFEAFSRAASGSPEWLDARIAIATETREAEQLLWALRRLERPAGLSVWHRRRDHLFAVIRPTAGVLPQAVRAFADADDLPRLSLPSPEGADQMHEAATFDAISRLDPDRAIDILRCDIGEDSELDALGTEGWWMPGLHHRRGDRLAAALRVRAARGSAPDRINRLARIYGGAPSLIDETTTDMLLDTLEMTITVPDVPPDEKLRGARRLLWTISSLRTPAPLRRISARRGTPLEGALASLAADRPPSSSRLVDRDGETMAHILGLMAGEGFDCLTLAQLASTGQTTREYGLGHALWTGSEAVGHALDAMADNHAADDEDRPYYLMQALAAHGRDGGLARLISASSPVYTHAVDIRHGRGGATADGALAEEVRARVVSDDAGIRIQAVDLAHFLPPEVALELTAPLLPLAAPGDALASRLMMLHFHHAHYEPALLGSLLPILADSGDQGQTTALHLALNGDARARREAARWLSARGQGAEWRSTQVALALIEHEDARHDAVRHLERLRGRRYRLGRMDAEVLEALARHGDAVASEELAHLAYGTDSSDLDAVAGAVRLIARRDLPIAYQAARRLFARSGQQEAARLLIEADATKGLTELVTAYLGATLPRRLAIARALRWHAPRERLEPVLAGMALATDEATRGMAAEIAGWLPHAWSLPWLNTLADDPVRVVEQAALAAIRRRADGTAAEELFNVIPALPKPAQWAHLRALTELVDPHLLSKRGDPLDLRVLIAVLPPEFGIEAQRLIDRRRTEVDRNAERAARE